MKSSQIYRNAPRIRVQSPPTLHRQEVLLLPGVSLPNIFGIFHPDRLCISNVPSVSWSYPRECMWGQQFSPLSSEPWPAALLSLPLAGYRSRPTGAPCVSAGPWASECPFRWGGWGMLTGSLLSVTSHRRRGKKENLIFLKERNSRPSARLVVQMDAECPSCSQLCPGWEEQRPRRLNSEERKTSAHLWGMGVKGETPLST